MKFVFIVIAFLMLEPHFSNASEELVSRDWHIRLATRLKGWAICASDADVYVLDFSGREHKLRIKDLSLADQRYLSSCVLPSPDTFVDNLQSGQIQTDLAEEIHRLEAEIDIKRQDWKANEARAIESLPKDMIIVSGTGDITRVTESASGQYAYFAGEANQDRRDYRKLESTVSDLKQKRKALGLLLKNNYR